MCTTWIGVGPAFPTLVGSSPLGLIAWRVSRPLQKGATQPRRSADKQIDIAEMRSAMAGSYVRLANAWTPGLHVVLAVGVLSSVLGAAGGLSSAWCAAHAAATAASLPWAVEVAKRECRAFGTAFPSAALGRRR